MYFRGYNNKKQQEKITELCQRPWLWGLLCCASVSPPGGQLGWLWTPKAPPGMTPPPQGFGEQQDGEFRCIAGGWGDKGNRHCLWGLLCHCWTKPWETHGGARVRQVLGPFQAPALTQRSPEPVKILAQQVDVTSCPPSPCQRTCEWDTGSGAQRAHPHSAPAPAASATHSRSQNTLLFFLSPHFFVFPPPFPKARAVFLLPLLLAALHPSCQDVSRAVWICCSGSSTEQEQKGKAVAGTGRFF